MTIAKVTKKGPLAKFHKDDGIVDLVLFYLAAVFSVAVKLLPVSEYSGGAAENVTFLAEGYGPEVGPMALDLAGTTLFTVTIAGWLVTLLIEFGILEFIGTLMEPIMRKVF